MSEKSKRPIELGSPGVGVGARTAAALSLRAPTGMLPAVQSEIRAYIESVIAAGMLPASVRSPEQAVVILVKGRELGMQPMQALSSIYVVYGQPSLKTEAMLALAFQRIPDLVVEVVESTDAKADIVVRRGRSVYRSVWKIEDARRAGLLDKKDSGWSKYPSTMLRWRAIASALRLLAPDVMQGTYTVEELEGATSFAAAQAAAEAAVPPVVVTEPEPPRPAATEVKATLRPAEPEPAVPAAPVEKPAAEKPSVAKVDVDTVRAAWRSLVDLCVKNGIHPNEPGPDQAALRLCVDVLGRQISPELRAIALGKSSEPKMAEVLLDLRRVHASASRTQDPFTTDLPLGR